MTAVTAAPPPPTGREVPFTDKDFRMIAALANARYGLFLQPSKKALVHSRLAKRLRVLDLPDFEAYCALLDRPEGDAEQEHLLSALTTNVTHFFREMHHFDTLRDSIIPGLIARAKAGGTVRMWSSACSAGQEAYCMAAILLAAFPDAARHDIKILATDIDGKVVAQARRARYPAEQLPAIPQPFRKLMLADTRPGAELEMCAELRQLITFGTLNLIADWPMRRKFDVIFCRNAAIYFDKATQARLWQRFSDVLAPGGYLMIGHSERLSGPAQATMKNVGITTYQKPAVVADPATPAKENRT